VHAKKSALGIVYRSRRSPFCRRDFLARKSLRFAPTRYRDGKVDCGDACYGAFMKRPRIVVFASGTKDGGGSGFENLALSPDLDADIAAVVSNHEHGGVRARAEKLGVPFIYFPGPYTAEGYFGVLEKTRIRGRIWVAFSGWLKFAAGLDPSSTFNIHPALLSFRNRHFGGPGLYGHRVHEAVKDALERGEITESGLTMHFTTAEYDKGPIFFEYRVPLQKGMTVDEIAKAVNIAEHRWQPKITNMVVHQEISWDGKDPASLKVPTGYIFLPQ
jgi:phosphoribosylglycinamide formyltransferase 1